MKPTLLHKWRQWKSNIHKIVICEYSHGPLNKPRTVESNYEIALSKLRALVVITSNLLHNV